MKKISGFILLFFFAMGNAQNAEEIIKNSRDCMKIEGLESISTLRIYDQRGRERIRKTLMISKDDGKIEKRVIRFLEPADVKGTGFLIFDYKDKDDDMWIYLPAIKKSRRIVSSDKGKNFMGSEFSNADMTAPSLKDYTYKLLGSEILENTMCWKIESTPANPNLAKELNVSKKIVYINKETFVPKKTEYYNLEKELWKVLQTEETKKLSENKYIATKMKMDNILTKRSSVMIMEQVVQNKEIKDSYFHINSLK